MNKTEMNLYLIKKVIEISHAEQITKSIAVDKIRRLHEPKGLTKGQQSVWYKTCNKLQDEYQKVEQLSCTRCRDCGYTLEFVGGQERANRILCDKCNS